MRGVFGPPPSLTDGLLGRRRSRRGWLRSPFVVLAIALAAGLWVGWRLGHDPTPVDTELAEAVPSDHLLPLRAPEIRSFGAADHGESEVDFAPGSLAAPHFPTYVEGAIASGESLTGALSSRGVPGTSLHPVVASLGEIFDFRRSQVGDRFEVELTSDGVVSTLRYQTSPEVVYEARRVGEGRYESRQIEVPLNTEITAVVGTIEGSFFGSVTALGEQESLARDVVSIFQWDIDFSRDVRAGDAFRLLFEKVYLDGEFLRYGRVLAAEYAGGRVTHAAYYFDDPEHAGYYTAEGVPLERMFLAAPCRHRRISSLFDLNRMHPVMNRRAPHLGVDYAADTGTPVWAAADGVVSHVGFNSRAGNMVKIEHASHYETVYAHLSRFARGMREGDEVQQGQVIGFVGNTGMSTGPHLHYGLKYRGEYVDPLGQDWSRGEALSGRALRDFQRRQSQLVEMMAATPMPTVTSSPEPSDLSAFMGMPEFFEVLHEADADDY